MFKSSNPAVRTHMKPSIDKLDRWFSCAENQVDPGFTSIGGFDFSILDERRGYRCCRRDLSPPLFLAVPEANRQTCTPFSAKGVQI